MDLHLKYFILGILFTVFVSTIGIGIYLLGKSQTAGTSFSGLVQPTLSAQNQTQPLLPQAGASQKPEEPKIYIEDGGGAISEADKDLIVKRVIGPFVDYYKDSGQGKIVTLTVSLNNQPSNVTYPYLVNAVFDTGVKISFVIKRSESGLDWWAPECMGPCLLTDDFRAKYPEIVKILE
jgi:hypothetical protein